MNVTIPLVGETNTSKSVQLNPQTLINLFPVSIDPGSGEKRTALYKTPGTSLWNTLPNMGTIRGLLEYNDVLYAVSDNLFYVVGVAGDTIILGTLVTSVGRVNIINNGFELMLDDGKKGYTYDLATNVFAQIADVDYIPNGYITYQAGRGIYSKPNSNRFYLSDLSDFTSWDSTLFASAETIPQNLVLAYAPVGNRTDLFLFGEKSVEPWVLTGDALFPYEPRAGVNIPYGCEARFSVATVNGTVIWLGKNDQGKTLLLTLDGYTPKILCDESATYQLNQLTRTDDATAFVFQLNGHIFYVISFPTDKKTFGFDISTQKLFRWASWQSIGTDNAGNDIYAIGRHLSDHFVFFNNKLIVSDYRGAGRLLELSDNVYTDYEAGVDDSIYFEVTTPYLVTQQRWAYINNVAIYMETGVSPISEAEASATTNLPLMSAAISKDGGHSFGNPRLANIGYTGQYNHEINLRNWGRTKNGVVKLYGNHSAFVALIDVYLDVAIEQSGGR
jgi:hypothetical protein